MYKVAEKLTDIIKDDRGIWTGCIWTFGVLSLYLKATTMNYYDRYALYSTLVDS